jgi:hypothetical protein
MDATKCAYLVEWYEIDDKGIYGLNRAITANATNYIFRHECGDIVLKSIEPIADKGYHNA